ncbi:MAG: prepilin peptidase [Actinomycetota bacterium]
MIDPTFAAISGAGALGLAVGSFLNVVFHRVPLRESVINPGSRCPNCKTQIRPLDKLPLVSWLFLRGRCRNCEWQIPASYPLVELGTGLAFSLMALLLMRV